MPDIILKRRPPVDAAAVQGEGIKLSIPAPATILHILGASGDIGLSQRLMAAFPGHALRFLAPDQWLLVLEEEASRAALDGAAGDAAIVDQSHGRARIRVEGAHAAQVLMKATAVDLDAKAFPVGSTAVTLFGHIAAQMTRVEADAFELLVLRGFAESLWEELGHLAAEYLPAAHD